MRRLDPGEGSGSGMEGLEPEHGTGDPLDETMILLKDVVEIFDLHDLDHAAGAGELQDHIDALQPRQIGSTFVDDHPIRNAVRADRAFEKPSGSALLRRSDSMKSRV